MRHKFTLLGMLPNLNEYIKDLNVSKFRGASLKKQTERVLALAIRRQLKGIRIKNPVVVKFLWVEANQRRDKDNIAFAKKFIFDALVTCGVLEGDGWRYVVGFSDDFSVDKTKPRVEVEIIEVEQ